MADTTMGELFGDSSDEDVVEESTAVPSRLDSVSMDPGPISKKKEESSSKHRMEDLFGDDSDA